MDDFISYDIALIKNAKVLLRNMFEKRCLSDMLDVNTFADCYITGGSISNALFAASVGDYTTNLSERDIDIYAKNKESMDIITKHLFELDKIKSIIKEQTTYNLGAGNNKLITRNAITLKSNLQFVNMDTFENCWKDFDFLHTKPYYDINNDLLHISYQQYMAIMNKTLVEVGPRIKEYRVQKFLDRGWVRQGQEVKDKNYQNAIDQIGKIIDTLPAGAPVRPYKNLGDMFSEYTATDSIQPRPWATLG